MRLKFVEPASAGIFLAAGIGIDAARKTVEQSFALEQAMLFAQPSFGHGDALLSLQKNTRSLSVFIGETVSRVYAPYFAGNGFIGDAITGAAVAGLVQNQSWDMTDGRPAFPSFLSMLCPSCGWDLQGQADSLVLLCTNCGRAWHAPGQSLQECTINIWETAAAVDLWIPFFRLEVKPQNLALATVADFIRLTNAPRAIQSGMETQAFYFWVPAFKTNPELFLRLCRLLTLRQKEIADAALPSKASFYPVTLPANEGCGAAAIVLADISTAKRKVVPLLEAESFSLTSAMLVYVPFVLKGQEYIQPELNASINSNALKWGRNI